MVEVILVGYYQEKLSQICSETSSKIKKNAQNKFGAGSRNLYSPPWTRIDRGAAVLDLAPDE